MESSQWLGEIIITVNGINTIQSISSITKPCDCWYLGKSLPRTHTTQELFHCFMEMLFTIMWNTSTRTTKCILQVFNFACLNIVLVLAYLNHSAKFFRELQNLKTCPNWKHFADCILNIAQKKKKIKIFKWVENIVRKLENAGYQSNQHFLLFPQYFQKASFLGLLKLGWYDKWLKV